MYARFANGVELLYNKEPGSAVWALAPGLLWQPRGHVAEKKKKKTSLRASLGP